MVELYCLIGYRVVLVIVKVVLFMCRDVLVLLIIYRVVLVIGRVVLVHIGRVVNLVN